MKRDPRSPLEREAQATILLTARLFGWRVAHFRPAQNRRGEWETPVAGDGKGWPDLVLVRCDRILFRELKVHPNRPTAEQVDWLESLTVAGCDAGVWMIREPGDLDAILEQLR